MASIRRPLLCGVVYLGPGLASPLPWTTARNFKLSARDPQHPLWGCPFEGNSDLYGLGIRLGVYLQLFSTLLANSFCSDTVREDARNTNAIIMIAVFAGMANATAQGNMNSVEIFVMSTLITAFMWSACTPGHISRVVLLDTETSKAVAAHEVEAKERKSYFAAIARSTFGTALATYNFWYWLYGRHQFLHNGITNLKCKPTIFLHTQIILDGYEPMFYVILAVGYAIWEVFFMAWWLFVLLPPTARLLYEIIALSIIAPFRQKRSAAAEMRSKIAQWYIGFARLNARSLRTFDRVRISPETQAKLRKYKPLTTWFGLPAGYGIFVFTAIAIELTLAWNSVSNIYVLGSTGQLIPFVVGVLGLLRILHLIAVGMSETVSHRLDKDISVALHEGRFVYEVGKGRELAFQAGIPGRRWSIDSGSQIGRVLDGAAERTSIRSLSWKTN